MSKSERVVRQPPPHPDPSESPSVEVNIGGFSKRGTLVLISLWLGVNIVLALCILFRAYF